MSDDTPTLSVHLVEDEDAHVELIRRSLAANPNIVLSHSGSLAAARAAVAERAPDVLICDYRLPDGKGSELLLGKESERDFPVVILTSQGDEVVAAEVMRAGAYDYLPKTAENMREMRHIVERTRLEWVRQRAYERHAVEAAKMQALGRIAGGIAHDFNNLLACIIGNAELGLTDLERGDPASARGALDDLLVAAHRSKDLVKQLMAFSVTDATPGGTADVASMLREVVAVLEPTTSAVTWTTAVADGLPPIAMADAVLRRVLLNLCANACEAMSGRGEVHLEGEERSLDEEVVCSSCHRPFTGRYAAVSVRDSGAGIATCDLAKVFEPFFSTKARAQSTGQGTGLGLAVVHGAVHHHDGHLTVESSSAGTLVTLYLPTTSRGDAPPPRVVSAGTAATRTRPHRGRVMILDDEALLANLFGRVFDAHGFSAAVFTDPCEAVAALEANPDDFDLLVSDLSMAGLSGLEVAARAIAARPDLPIILCSGFANAAEARPELGIRRFFAKPFDPSELVAAAEELMRPAPKSRP